ncbi:MAG: hypothetical protein ABIH66_07260, partial [bacterium]
TIHIYQPGVAPESGWFREWIDNIYEVIESYGGGKEVWISESGWPTNRGVSENWQGISLEDNARYLVRAQVLALAGGIGKFFWFSFRNGGTDITNFEHNQGIMFNDLTPKPSLVTYSVLTQMLRGTNFEKLVEFGDGGTADDTVDGFAAFFSGGGRHVVVVWSAGKKFELPAPPDARVVDMVGREAEISENKLEITGSPVYIVLSDQGSAEAWGEVFGESKSENDGEICTKAGTDLNMTYEEAVGIAASSECTQDGKLKEEHFCNENTGTWWIDLEIDKKGCYPACVVNVGTKEAEINWRCTGLIAE